MSFPRFTRSEVTIGILGNGSMGSVHAGSYGRIKNVKVIDVFSRNQERKEAVAQIVGAKPVNDAFALLDHPAIDAIDVRVPSMNHREFVLAALQRGKHVFCETPFGFAVSRWGAMIETARASNRIFLVGLLLRSIAQYEYVHRVATSGRLGRVLSLTAFDWRSTVSNGAPVWSHLYRSECPMLRCVPCDFFHAVRRRCGHEPHGPR
jgi:UDP-N-acetylglucosamine 3-dehydrogenase